MKCLVGLFGALMMVVTGLAGCSSEENAGPETVAWCELDPPDRRGELTAVSFPDPATGTVVGGIYRTTDAGRTWTMQESPLGEARYADVVFTDGNTGTIVGDGGTILRTTDGGASWNAQESGTQATLRGVSFGDANHGMVVGDAGTLLRTTDGGASWVTQESGTDSALLGVWMSDAETATVVGAAGTILRTADGGLTWAPQVSGTDAQLEAVSFPSVETGVAVGSAGLILRTTDGGTTWTRITGFGTETLHDVWFADANVGTIVGGAGTILRTTDAGATWVSEPTDAAYTFLENLDSEPVRIFNTFYGVSMPGVEDGIAVGDLSTYVQRAALRDRFGVCDPWCAKEAACYPEDIVRCDIGCLCELHYAKRISEACEEAIAASIACFAGLTCEQIDAYFDDPDNHPCTAVEERLDAACS